MSKTTTDGHRESCLERELSLEELEAVSGGDTHKVTTGDVAAAAKWVWNKLF